MGDAETFAARAGALAGELEAFAVEAERVVEFRRSQGKPALSDGVGEALGRGE